MVTIETGIHLRRCSGSSFQPPPTRFRPLASVARRRYPRTDARARLRLSALATLGPLRRAFPEQALGPEDEDRDQDREHRSEERRVRKECRSRWSPYH